MATQDYVVPDEETESSPGLDDLIAIFPSDEDTNRLNATKLRNLLRPYPRTELSRKRYAHRPLLQDMLGGTEVSVQYAETNSDDR